MLNNNVSPSLSLLKSEKVIKEFEGLILIMVPLASSDDIPIVRPSTRFNSTLLPFTLPTTINKSSGTPHESPNSTTDFKNDVKTKADWIIASTPLTAVITEFKIADIWLIIGGTNAIVPFAISTFLSNFINVLDNIVNTFTGKATAGAPKAVGIGIAFIIFIILLIEFATDSVDWAVAWMPVKGAWMEISAAFNLLVFSIIPPNVFETLSISWLALSFWDCDKGGIAQTLCGVNKEVGFGILPFNKAIGSNGSEDGSIPAFLITSKDCLISFSFIWSTEFWTLSESLTILTKVFVMTFAKLIICFYLP